MLVGQLSDTSALAASARGGPEFRSWDLANTLRAAAANQLYAANQQRAQKRNIKPLIKPPQRRVRPRVVHIADIGAQPGLPGEVVSN